MRMIEARSCALEGEAEDLVQVYDFAGLPYLADWVTANASRTRSGLKRD